MYNAKMTILSLLLGLAVVLPVVAAEEPKPNSSDASAVAAAPKADVIDVNTADAETLSKLDGIGPKKAAAIIEFRQKYGPFKDVAELSQVDGIGDKTIEKNKDRIVLSQPATKTENAPTAPAPTEAVNPPPAADVKPTEPPK